MNILCACLTSIVHSLQGNSFLHLYVEVILPLTRDICFSSPCFWFGLVTALVKRLYGMWCYGTSVLNLKKPGSFHSFLEHSCHAGRSPRDVEENRTLSVRPQLSSQTTARINQPREFSTGMSGSEKPPHCQLATSHRTEKHPVGPKSNHKVGKIIKMITVSKLLGLEVFFCNIKPKQTQWMSWFLMGTFLSHHSWHLIC